MRREIYHSLPLFLCGSEATYFSTYHTISPKAHHPKCIRLARLIEQKAPCVLEQYRTLLGQRISGRTTSNENYLVRIRLLLIELYYPPAVSVAQF